MQTRAKLFTGILGLAFLVNSLKGIAPKIGPHMWPYWQLTYQHGFIRRGLLGTIFQAFASELPEVQQQMLVMELHTVVWVALAIIPWMVLFRHRSITSARTSQLVLLGLASLLLSVFYPTIGVLAGYLDPFLVLLCAIAGGFAYRRQYRAAGFVAAVGPFMHDAFAFLWLPIVLAVGFDRKRGRATSLAWLAAPFVMEGIVLAFHSTAAFSRCLATLPPESAGIRVFEQPAAWMFQRMADGFVHNTGRFFLAVGFYGWPAAVAGSCATLLSRGWRRKLLVWCTTLAPCTIFFVAWDLTRFLAWIHIGSFVALSWAARAAEEDGGTVEESSSSPPQWLMRITFPILLVTSIGGPSTYSYFDYTFAFYVVGPRAQRYTPAAHLSYAWLNVYNRDLSKTSFSTNDACTLEGRGFTLENDCLARVARSGFVESPQLVLQRGVYEAKIQLSSACDVGLGTLSVQSRWRLAPTAVRSIRIDAVSASNASLVFEVDAEEAAMGNIRVRVDAEDGCLEIRSVEVRRR